LLKFDAHQLASISVFFKIILQVLGARYLLTVIDVFSMFGWMLPLKEKTSKSVADAFKDFFKRSKRKPEKLWTDKGK